MLGFICWMTMSWHEDKSINRDIPSRPEHGGIGSYPACQHEQHPQDQDVMFNAVTQESCVTVMGEHDCWLSMVLLVLLYVHILKRRDLGRTDVKLS